MHRALDLGDLLDLSDKDATRGLVQLARMMTGVLKSRFLVGLGGRRVGRGNSFSAGSPV